MVENNKVPKPESESRRILLEATISGQYLKRIHQAKIPNEGIWFGESAFAFSKLGSGLGAGALDGGSEIDFETRSEIGSEIKVETASEIDPDDVNPINDSFGDTFGAPPVLVKVDTVDPINDDFDWNPPKVEPPVLKAPSTLPPLVQPKEPNKTNPAQNANQTQVIEGPPPKLNPKNLDRQKATTKSGQRNPPVLSKISAWLVNPKLIAFAGALAIIAGIGVIALLGVLVVQKQSNEMSVDMPKTIMEIKADPETPVWEALFIERMEEEWEKESEASKAVACATTNELTEDQIKDLYRLNPVENSLLVDILPMPTEDQIRRAAVLAARYIKEVCNGY